MTGGPCCFCNKLIDLETERYVVRDGGFEDHLRCLAEARYEFAEWVNERTARRNPEKIEI